MPVIYQEFHDREMHIHFIEWRHSTKLRHNRKYHWVFINENKFLL